MFLFRKIGKTLRGGAKPYQVYTATVLGALIGFAPPFAHGPLWIIGLVILLAVINANLFIATFTAGVAKVLALLLTVVSFEIGLLLVDGPLQGVFAGLINGPGTALLGLDYYVTSGGAVLAVVLGAGWGYFVVRGLTTFRKRMAKVQEESEKYADWATKRWVRVLCWVFFGGKAKQSYAELLEQRKIGNPIRIPGVIFAVLLIGLLFIVQQFASSAIVTWYAKDALEKFNGATVDIEGVEVDLAGGKLTVAKLAMADPDNLGQDIFRAQELTADISASDLWRKRMTIDLVLVDDATSGQARDKAGVRIGDRPEPPKPTGEGKSIEEWFEQAQAWKERLETYRDWFEKIKGPPKEEDEGGIRGRAREIAAQHGYANARASHLIEGSPTLLVKKIEINKLRAQWPVDETLRIVATNISTQPGLAEEMPVIDVASSGRALEGGGVGEATFDARVGLAPRAWADAMSELRFSLRNQSVEETLAGFGLPQQGTLTGGTWSAGLDGDWAEDDLNLPLKLEVRDTSVAFGGLQPTPIESLPLTFGVNGTMADPRLALDMSQFAQTLKTVGMGAAAQLLEQQLGGQLDGILPEGAGGDIIDRAGGFLDGLRDGEDSDDAEDGDAAPEGGSGGGGGLGGLRDRLRGNGN